MCQLLHLKRIICLVNMPMKKIQTVLPGFDPGL